MRAAIEQTFKIGKSVQWGVLQADVDASKAPTQQEQKRRMDEAAAALTNIDAEERNRRKIAGLAGAAVACVVYGVTIYLQTGFVARAASIYLPVAFSAGFLTSSKEGL